jgi:hypothetical protein
MMISTSLRSQAETVDKQRLLSRSRQFFGALVGTTGATMCTPRGARYLYVRRTRDYWFPISGHDPAFREQGPRIDYVQRTTEAALVTDNDGQLRPHIPRRRREPQRLPLHRARHCARSASDGRKSRTHNAQMSGYATRTRHRQMTGRVIGSEVMHYERDVDYSVMHKSVSAAGKVTAQALLHFLI